MLIIVTLSMLTFGPAQTVSLPQLPKILIGLGCLPTRF